MIELRFILSLSLADFSLSVLVSKYPEIFAFVSNTKEQSRVLLLLAMKMKLLQHELSYLTKSNLHCHYSSVYYTFIQGALFSVIPWVTHPHPDWFCLDHGSGHLPSHAYWLPWIQHLVPKFWWWEHLLCSYQWSWLCRVQHLLSHSWFYPAGHCHHSSQLCHCSQDENQIRAEDIKDTENGDLN